MKPATVRPHGRGGQEQNNRSSRQGALATNRSPSTAITRNFDILTALQVLFWVDSDRFTSLTSRAQDLRDKMQRLVLTIPDPVLGN
jgi:hypothetical protein